MMQKDWDSYKNKEFFIKEINFENKFEESKFLGNFKS